MFVRLRRRRRVAVRRVGMSDNHHPLGLQEASRRPDISRRVSWSAPRKNVAPFAPLTPSRRSGLLRHPRTEERRSGSAKASGKATRPPRKPHCSGEPRG